MGRGTHDPHDPNDGDGRRWVVLDCESSGLDPERDRLLSIAAVAVHMRGTGLHIVPADSFEMVLQQPEQGTPPDKANILVHGIGIGAQRAGVAPAIALQAFRAYANGAPLIGHHVSFDRRLLERAERAELSVLSVLSVISNRQRAPRWRPTAFAAWRGTRPRLMHWPPLNCCCACGRWCAARPTGGPTSTRCSAWRPRGAGWVPELVLVDLPVRQFSALGCAALAWRATRVEHRYSAVHPASRLPQLVRAGVVWRDERA